MRTLHDLTPDEKSAYFVWQSRLSDRTLSAAEHDECRREIDALLWKGPNAQVLALKAELASISARLERLEFHAGLADGEIPSNLDESGLKQSAAASVRPSPESAKTVTEVTPSSPQTITPPEEDTPPPNEGDKQETRGRKKLRFHPERDANKKWQILDREDGDGEYTYHGPYKTRKLAKEMVDTLNGLPNPGPPGSYRWDKSAPPDGEPIGEVISRVSDDPNKPDIIQTTVAPPDGGPTAGEMPDGEPTAGEMPDGGPTAEDPLGDIGF